MTNRRTLSLAIIFAVILGVLVYVPVIPHSAPAYAFPAIYTCGGCVTEGISGNPITSHILNSITLQLFNFGGQYSIYSRFFRGSYNFCSFGGCESFWFVGVIYGFLIALAAINVGLIARFLSRRSGMGGASVQIGLGVFALIISPFLQLLNQYFRLRHSALSLKKQSSLELFSYLLGLRNSGGLGQPKITLRRKRNWHRSNKL